MHFNNPAKRDTGPRYLVDRILPLGYCAALLGRRESGKSSLAAALAISVASGKPFARRPTTMGGVLWLSAGETPFDRAVVNLPIYATNARPPIDTDEGIDELATWVRKVSARLIVVDPLDAHARLASWNTRETLARFKRLCYTMNVTGLLLHSIRTNVDPYQEVINYAAAVDQAIHLHTDDSVHPRLLTLRSAGRGEDVSFQIQLASESPFNYDYAGQPKPTPEPRRRSLDEQILAAIAQSRTALSAREISNHLQRNPNSIRNSLARLLAAGRIYCAHHASGARHYRTEKVSQMNPEKSVTI